MGRFGERIQGSRKGTGTYDDEVVLFECKVEGDLEVVSEDVTEILKHLHNFPGAAQSLVELTEDYSVSKVVDLCNRQIKTDARNGNAGSTNTGQREMAKMTKEANQSGNVDMDYLAKLIKKATKGESTDEVTPG